jgi:hypothetical protein
VSALLSPDFIQLRSRLAARSVTAGSLGAFRIGYVSGDKDFFHPTAAAVSDYSLPSTSLRPTLTNARRLRGQGLCTGSLDSAATSRLFLPGEALTAGEEKYVVFGEETGVDQRYKCRVRKPWYVVPDVRVPDLLLTVFSETPLLMANDGQYAASNSLLCFYLDPERSRDELVRQWYTSLTLLSIEEEVHALGGGVLVLVPREAARIRLVEGDAVARSSVNRIDERLQAGDVVGAYRAGDEALIASGLICEAELDILREGIDQLRDLRVAARG